MGTSVSIQQEKKWWGKVTRINIDGPSEDAYAEDIAVRGLMEGPVNKEQVH